MHKTIQKNLFKLKSVIKLTNRSDDQLLFNGDDKLFKDLIKNVDTYFEYGCGKSTEYVYHIPLPNVSWYCKQWK